VKKKQFQLSKEDQRSLRKRYLFWLYKMTKDELDRIDRKFTQLSIDGDIQELLEGWSLKMGQRARGNLQPFIKELEEYIFQKESDAQKLKFDETGAVNSKYLFLHMKFEAICSITKSLFGTPVLKEFRRLYEEASLGRILDDDSGKR
jgi:hypothetical protein